MTEDNRQKEIRLKKELAQVKAMNANADAKLKPTKDFSVGIPQDTSVKEKLPTSADNPDVVLLPPKRRETKRKHSILRRLNAF